MLRITLAEIDSLIRFAESTEDDKLIGCIAHRTNLRMNDLIWLINEKEKGEKEAYIKAYADLIEAWKNRIKDQKKIRTVLGRFERETSPLRRKKAV